MSERGWWGQHWDKWLGDTALLAFTAATGYLGQWASRETGDPKSWLGAGAVATGVAAAWVKIAQTRREKRVRAAREQAELAERKSARELHARDMTTFGSALKPGIEVLARLATTRKGGKDREGSYAAIRNKVVDAAAALTGGEEQVRAVFFRRDDRTAVPTLVRSEYAGAREPSDRTFKDHVNDPAGQEAWAALRAGKVVTWPDVTEHAPAGWDTASQSRPYRTFTMAPVLGPEGQVYGMLNVDALEPSAFGQLDEERLATLAALLGAAVHIASGNSQ